MKENKTKDLNYYKNNCEEDYIKTPISVLRYISELEQAINYTHFEVSVFCLYRVRCFFNCILAFIFERWKNIFKISYHIYCIYKIYMYICIS